MNQLFEKVQKNLDVHTKEVIQKSSASLVVRVFGILIGVGLSIFLGRILGPDGLGIINLANTLVEFLLLFALFGIGQIIVREVAIAKNNSNFQKVKQLINSSIFTNGLLGFLITLLLAVTSHWLSNKMFEMPPLKWPLVVISIGLSAQVISKIYSSGLIGYRKIWQSNLVDRTLSVFITSLICLLLWSIYGEIGVLEVAIAYAIGRICVTFTIGFYWNRLICPFSDAKAKVQKKMGLEMLRKGRPLFYDSISSKIMNTSDIILLGIYASAEQVGLYTISSRIALQTSIFLGVTNSVLSSNIAALLSENKINEVQLVIQKTTLGLIFIGLLQIIIVFFLGELVLSFWGEDFMKAYPFLLILSIGQLINISSGAAGQLLIMGGHEVIQKNISIIFMVLNLILNIILIYFYTALGAAYANAITISMLNLAKVYYAKKKTGVMTFPVNIF